MFLRFFPFDVISQCLCIRQTRLSASPADATTRRSGKYAHGGCTSRRAPLYLFVSRTRRVRALRGARATVAPAAWQLVLSSSCPVRRALAPAFLVALRRTVQGQPARADAAPLSVQGLSSALFRSVVSRRGDRGHPLLVECRVVTSDISLRSSTSLKLYARRSYK